MPVQTQFLEYILEQLAQLPALRSSRMFGGIGLYGDGLFFGLIDDDTVYFKTNDSNIAPYRERNMPRFMPFPDRPEAVLGYHQVPADVIEDAEMLVDWARKSVAVALSARSMKLRAKPAKARAKKPRPPAKRNVAKKPLGKKRKRARAKR